MASRFILAVLVTGLFACSQPEPAQPIVNLVPAEALVAIFPAEVDSFAAISDTTYLGYRATPTDTLALITAARIYEAPGGAQFAINLSSFNDRAQFMAIYGEGAIRDTTATRETYSVMMGRLILVDDNHAVEGKGFDMDVVQVALDLIDYERMAALTTVPMVVDSTFAMSSN